MSFSADKFFGFYLLNISCIFLICVSTSHWPSHRCQHLWPGTLQSPQSSPAGTQAPPTCTPQSFQSGQIRFCHVSHSTLTPLVIFFSIDFRMSTTTFSSWPEGVHGRVPIHFPSLVSQPWFLLTGLGTPRALQRLLPLLHPHFLRAQLSLLLRQAFSTSQLQFYIDLHNDLRKCASPCRM